MTTATEEAVVIDDMPIEDYHADKASISSSGLRKLLPPYCPAQFKWDRDNPPAPKQEFDFGHAAHHAILGDGPDVEVLDFDNYLTKAAKTARDEARKNGVVPVLRHEHQQVQAMAQAIRQHPVAGPLFAPGTGIPEQSIFWTDPATGVRCRVRPDWLKQKPGLALCVDYKTTADASPDGIAKAVQSYGYHQQDALYLDGIRAAFQPEDARFLFVFQQKTAPYLITVRELTDETRDIGRARNERALRIYADCMARNEWPDWTGPITDIPELSLPKWAAINEAKEYIRD